MSITEVRIQHSAGETYGEHAAKNAQGLQKLLALLARNVELSLKDIRWAQENSNPSAEEISDYLKSRTEKDAKHEDEEY